MKMAHSKENHSLASKLEQAPFYLKRTEQIFKAGKENERMLERDA
jgi:hypothetical protein